VVAVDLPVDPNAELDPIAGHLPALSQPKVLTQRLLAYAAEVASVAVHGGA
jgi:hypothetical protein